MRLLHWIERAAFVIGIVLLLSYFGARLWAESWRVHGLEAVRQAAAAEAQAEVVAGSTSAPASVVSTTHASSSTEHRFPDTDQSLWSAQRVRAFAQALTTPGRPEGALLIPSIRLEVPVYVGTTELNLNRGAAHIEGTSALGANGNTGIAAHRDGFFRGLEALRIDEEVILEVGVRTLRYRVVDIRIVTPTDVHVLAPTANPSITLVTCYPFYFVGRAPERYIVRAELVERADLILDGDPSSGPPTADEGGES